MATLQGKAVKNTYRQVLQIGANNVGVSGSLQPVQDGAGVNTALSLSTAAATINGNLTITGDLIITGGGIEIKELIDDTVAALIRNGTGITWTYNDGAASLTGNFTGTTSVVAEGSNLYYTQGRFDSAFAAKSTTNLAEGANLYFTEARGNANFATNFATKTTTNLPEGTNLYFTDARARLALSITAGTGIAYNNTTGVFNLAAIPNASLTNSSITINGQAVSLGGSVTLTTTNIGEGTNLYWTEARGNANFTTNLAASSTTNLAEGTNLYYTQARFDTAFSNKSTTNLAEGTNLYYTQARFNSALSAKTTTDLAEGTNLYYTDARARLALSSSATGLSYANNSGVFSLTAGYAIPTTVKLGQYDIAYNRSIVSAAVSGTSTKTLSLTQQDANVITATWTDQGITTINGTANQIATTTVGNTTTVAFTNDVTMPNNLVVSGNLTINGTATFVNTESISSKDPLFEVANTNNTTDAVDIGYYGRYYDAVQERVEFTGLFRDASDAGKFKIFTGLVDEPTNVVNTTGTGYTVATLVANVDGSLNGTANAANILSTARTIAASGDATWSVSFNGSANVSSALTLANTGVTATTYGTSTAVPTIAVDSKGRITSASNTNITFPVTTVNGQAGTVVLTTSDVAEGSNQYFTTGRVAAYLTGAISTVLTTDLTASRAVASNASGKLVSSGTTDTELGYLSGVTSAVQTQLNSKLNLSGGTLTGGLSGTTGTFSGILTTPQVKAATSAGLSINANSGTQVADFGAGGSANITFFGGLAGTSATFSGALSSNSLTLTNALSVANGGTGTTSFTAQRIIYGNGTSALATSSNFYWETANNRLWIDRNDSGNISLILKNAFLNQGSLLQFQKNITTTGAINSYIGLGGDSTNNFIINHGGSDRLIITSSGDVGIGTSGFAWAAPFRALQIGGFGSFIAGRSDGQEQLQLGSNAYYGASGWVRASSGFASRIVAIGGGFEFSTTSASNSANTAITWNPAMTISSDSISVFSSASSIIANGQGIRVYSTNSQGADLGGGISFGGYYVGTSTIADFANIKSGKDNSTSGNYSGYLSFSTNNQATGNIERMRITSGGNVGIAVTPSSGIRLQVRAETSDSSSQAMNIGKANGADLIYVRADGYLYSVGAWSGSDIRLKENITELDNGLQKVLKLKSKKFDLIDGLKNNFGFIAQEMQEVIPDAVSVFEEKEQLLAVRMDFIIPHLVKAIQEQQAQIEELKALIAAK